MSLQEQMIQYRARERITQQEFAERCGLSKQAIHLVECGKRSPSKITQAKIELVLRGGNKVNNN